MKQPTMFERLVDSNRKRVDIKQLNEHIKNDRKEPIEQRTDIVQNLNNYTHILTGKPQ